jgi:hypothetical protein
MQPQKDQTSADFCYSGLAAIEAGKVSNLVHPMNRVLCIKTRVHFFLIEKHKS